MERRAQNAEWDRPDRGKAGPSDAFRARLYRQLRQEMAGLAASRRRRSGRLRFYQWIGLAAAAALLLAALPSFTSGPTYPRGGSSARERRLPVPHPPGPENSRAWASRQVRRAEGFARQGRPERVIECCRAAIEKLDAAEPADGFLQLQAQALLQLGRRTEAARCLARLVREVPFSRHAAEASGALMRLDPDTARKLGLDAEPELDLEERAQEAIGSFHGTIWQQDVLSRFARHFPRHPLSPRAVLRLGQLQQERGQVVEATRLFAQVVDRWPQSDSAAEAQAHRVQCYRQRGFLFRADEECRDLVARFPDSPATADAILELGNHWYAAGEFDRAAEWFYELVRRFPSDAFAENAHFRIGQCYRRSQDFELSARKFEEFAREFPESILCPKALASGGDAYLQARELRRAYDLYQTCIALYPNSLEAHQARSALARADFQTISGPHNTL
ncbi:MAG: tetratricopeptide repeat protein [Planctomycetes bacterium]|nr:tetratricopeptide repeat protein [Planctomycetota bacterium]